MIEFLSGKLIKKKSDFIVIDVSGIGYKVFISLNSYNNLCSIDENITIDTYFHVNENSQTLYGFKNVLEKELFIMLISISGIGPKTAINLLSAVDPHDFKNRLIAGEVKMLTSLPGIGPKTAKRIIIELKDKFIKTKDDDLPYEEYNEVGNDAYSALLNLGFQSQKIRKVIKKVLEKNNNIGTEKLIKESLKNLR
tara:strand:- start:2498 stop:3082 length:585 start_codon:yes stop_codon:yes gene_type:complete